MTITQQELAGRIRRAREEAGLTQAQVAAALDLARPTVVQIEAGKRMVSGLELERLARLCGRALADFFDEDLPPSPLEVLLRSAGVMQDDDVLRQDVNRCLELGQQVRDLEEILGQDPSTSSCVAYDLGFPRGRWEAITQGEEVARRERHRLGLESGPLPNLFYFLPSQGVTTLQARLRDGLSGLMVRHPSVGILIVANSREVRLRRRFSFAHEYGHALVDGRLGAVISVKEKREDLIEVRANAFAAAFLMPDDGVRHFLQSLGKGQGSRQQAEVVDADDAVLHAESRTPPHSQDVQIYDAVLLAHHFGVSVPAALYRLLSLKLVTRPVCDQLREQWEKQGRGHRFQKLLGLPVLDESVARAEFPYRLISLALEAYRRAEISKSKLLEIADLIDMPREVILDFIEVWESGRE